jgi:hypothetical protein
MKGQVLTVSGQKKKKTLLESILENEEMKLYWSQAK